MKAIGFDLGETLLFYRGTPLSWKPLYSDALNFTASGCGYVPTVECINKASLILEEYNTRIHPRTIEVASDVIIGKVLESWGLCPAQHLDSATRDFFSFFQKQAAVYPDTLPVLEMLKQRGIKTGILTDVPYGMTREFVQHDLDAAGILNYHIDVLLTSVDTGHRKPNATGYLRLMHELGVEAHEMAYIGNERKDVEGANAAGIRSILLSREGEPYDWGQQHTIGSLNDVIDLL